MARPGYVDPFSRLEQKQNQNEGDKISLKGTPKITLDENDEDDLNVHNARAVASQRIAKAEVDQEFEQRTDRRSEHDDVRRSVQTIVSQRQSMTESQVLNAIADVIMQEVNPGDPEASMSMSQKGFTQSVEHQIGEELII